jgi:hypothetical protein
VVTAAVCLIVICASRYSAVELLRWRFVCTKERREGLGLIGPHSAERLKLRGSALYMGPPVTSRWGLHTVGGTEMFQQNAPQTTWTWSLFDRNLQWQPTFKHDRALGTRTGGEKQPIQDTSSVSANITSKSHTLIMLLSVRFRVLTAANVKLFIFCDSELCNLV